MSNIVIQFDGFRAKSQNPRFFFDGDFVTRVKIYGHITLRIDEAEYAGDVECLEFFEFISQALLLTILFNNASSGGVMESSRQIYVGPSESDGMVQIGTDTDGLKRDIKEVDLDIFARKLGGAITDLKTAFFLNYPQYQDLVSFSSHSALGVIFDQRYRQLVS